MTASDGFAEFLSDQLAPLGRITMRRMFGKTGVFCDGFMLGYLGASSAGSRAAGRLDENVS
jgi:DNA transformation protein